MRGSVRYHLIATPLFSIIHTPIQQRITRARRLKSWRALGKTPGLQRTDNIVTKF